MGEGVIANGRYGHTVDTVSSGLTAVGRALVYTMGTAISSDGCACLFGAADGRQQINGWSTAVPSSPPHLLTLSWRAQAVKRDASGDYAARDQTLNDILRPYGAQWGGGFGPLDNRIGNSMEDLRLSVRGWRLGNMVASGRIQTNTDLANWLALYVGGD